VNTPTVSKASVGTKRKAAEQNVGRRRKAPKRTITHLDFPNYGHLEIIPRKPEDVTHSFHDVSKLSEFSRPRQFFKKSPIPEEYKKRCANKTTRLNLTLTGSFGKRAGAVSKRRPLQASFCLLVLISRLTTGFAWESSLQEGQKGLHRGANPLAQEWLMGAH